MATHPYQDPETFVGAKHRLGFSHKGFGAAVDASDRTVRRWEKEGPPYTVAVLLAYWDDPDRYPVPKCPAMVRLKVAS